MARYRRIKAKASPTEGRIEIEIEMAKRLSFANNETRCYNGVEIALTWALPYCHEYDYEVVNKSIRSEIKKAKIMASQAAFLKSELYPAEFFAGIAHALYWFLGEDRENPCGGDLSCYIEAFHDAGLHESEWGYFYKTVDI